MRKACVSKRCENRRILKGGGDVALMAWFLAVFLQDTESPRTQQGPAREPEKVDPMAELSSLPDRGF